MNKKAALAVSLVILIPLISYFLVRYYSMRDVQMPIRYFYDDVKIENGKPDTIWHKMTSPQMVNQFGDTVTLGDLTQKVLVLDFFFTRCPTICPKMAQSMKRLQNSFTKNDSIVQFISISVDPRHDSVGQLKKWAEKFQIDPDNWWLLTGNRDSIYDFGIKQLKANIADPGVDTAFIHTEKFFLLDKERVLRGFYDGLDSVAMKKLVRDVPLLMLEKDRKRTFGEFLQELFSRS